MASLIYLLCAATALACAVVLWNNFRSSRTGMVFWSSVCFLGLATESLLLYVDRIAFPRVDLSAYRHVVGLVALASLLFAFIWGSSKA